MDHANVRMIGLLHLTLYIYSTGESTRGKPKSCLCHAPALLPHGTAAPKSHTKVIRKGCKEHGTSNPPNINPDTAELHGTAS